MKKRLLICGGKVLVGDPRKGIWSDSVLIEDGKIALVSVNSTEHLREKVSSNEILDVGGSLVLPGFCDAHIHLALGGESLGILNLGGKNFADAITELKKWVSEAEGDGVVEAFNWDAHLCPLTADVLEDILPNRPLIVHRRDLHSCCVNRTVLKNLGLSDSSPDPYGGSLGRDAQGHLNGHFYEGAVRLVLDRYRQPTESQKRSHILRGMKYLNSLGLTAVSEVLNPGDEVIYKELALDNELTLTIDAWWRQSAWDGKMKPLKVNNHFWVRTLKVFLDGSFGSRTAALFKPYIDQPNNQGILYFDDQELSDIVQMGINSGWRFAFHAIGDRAVDQAIRVLGPIGVLYPNIHRVEHLELFPEDGVERFVKSGLIASVQPVHLEDDSRWLQDCLGETRCERTFIWRSIIERGTILAAGSDWPVASPNPIKNVMIMLQRDEFSASTLGHSGEALNPRQALYAITLGWAQAAGVEDKFGTIEPNKFANITVVSGVDQDLADWSKAEIELTVHNGQIVYQK